MKKLTGVRVVVVGSNDRQLEDTLRADGAAVTMQSMDVLAALAHPQATAPDAVIVDVRDDATLPAALAPLKRYHPTVGVVIVARMLDPNLMLEAMRAGVSEWLTDPVKAETLLSIMERVVAQRTVKQVTGSVFAFVGAKGGVGTTTAAVNVASALRGGNPRSSLLIDLHTSYGDAALFLGAEPKFSVADALENVHRLDEAFFRGLVTHTKNGPDLLASSDRGTHASVNGAHVKQLIDVAAQHYAYVILDVPRTDVIMLDSLDLAGDILVFANQELATVRRAGPLMLSLRQRYGKERVSVVVTRFDKNAEIQREDIERVTGSIRHVVPSDYRLALTSLNKGQPVVIENHNRLAAAFVGLAGLLTGGKQHQPAAAKPTGLLSRLGVR